MNNTLVVKSMVMLIAISIIATPIPAYSQETNANGENIEVVHLNNGDVIKGTIIENVINEYVKIELQGGSILTFPYSDIEKISKENVQKEGNRKKTTSNSSQFNTQQIPAYSQETNTNGGTFTEGLMQGQMMAKGNATWVVGGFCCGIFGVGGAYLLPPSPPVQMLIGKSAEYVMGFTEGYKNESKKKNATYASLGCLGGMLFNLLMGV